MQSIPTLEAIQKAAQRIQPFVHQTPVLSSQTINKQIGASLFFKCENFQKTGSFKMRGASNLVMSLSVDAIKNGVATQSSGNHGQALARIAQLLGIPAYIVMPNNSARPKIQSVEAYQGKVIFCEPTIQAREAAVEKVLQETGAYYIPPYNDYGIIAGQGTVTLELINEISDLDIIISPIGGGGLMSGTALATHYLLPKARIIGVEPAAVDDALRSVKTGILQENKTTNTIADGLRASLRDKTFGVIREYVHEIYTVEEHEIIAAMRLIWERMKITIEPSCAVPFAADLFGKIPDIQHKKIGIILTGGNVDLDKLPWATI
ncbi:MAG: pyridoxal-phosphate dependent enzyme [Thermoflexibacteraceae bacterium]